MDTLFQYKIPKETHFYEKALTKNVVSYKSTKCNFTADPLLNAIGGYDFAGKKATYESGLGVKIQGDFYKKLAFGGSFLYNQSCFPEFITEEIEKSRIVSGQGYAYKSASEGYNYLNYDLFASYNFLKYFTLEAGFGKNFWGDGYRSLFLSDNAYNYPYLKLTTHVWHFKLVNLYTNFKDMTGIPLTRWRDMTNKYGAFHYLSWDISKRVNLGFFESIIWQGKDSAGNRGFDINYLNPILFLRPVEFSRGSPDNALLGVSLRVKVGKKTSIYGQLLIDDIIWGEALSGTWNRIKKIFHPHDTTLSYGFWTNKAAWQIGVKSYDLFKIKNLSALLEFNFARPYTYAHRIVTQNYGHYNEPLAHPAGANFRETVLLLRYSYKRWFFECHLNYIVTGMDTLNSDFGQDIYKPVWDVYDPAANNVPVQHYFNNIAQGIKTRIEYYSVNAAYLINPKNNLRVVLGYYYRSSASSIKNNYANVVTFGIKMSIPDKYYDY
ncbi:MAG: hypothetical protein WCQ95_11350 [Bacteroidota bacterium]